MRASALALLALALAPAAARAGATIEIVNNNAPGVGFNDSTPATPVGGNPGTTLGDQRLAAFRHAAGIWGETLDSRVPIRVRAQMTPLSCTATSATLGSAGPTFVESDFEGAEYPDRWYHVALANKRAGVDFVPGQPHINANFNSELGKPGCLTGSPFYLGFDRAPAGQISLVTVLLHEFAHGLGFSSVTNVSTGALLASRSDVYSKFLLDLTTGKTRDEMTQAERVASAINFRKVAWTGPRVTSSVPGVLAAGTPLLSAGGTDYVVATAAFGPPLGSPNVTAPLVAALDAADAAGPSTFDACSAILSDVAGKVALVTRGTCGFAVKVKNAQLAGAVAVVVQNNAAGSAIALGGADPTITIPTASVSLADGNTLRAALAGGPITAFVGVDPGVRSGASRSGFALMYSVNPVAPGSSISHWDTSAFPNQLMEPAINADLTFSVQPPQDLTLPMFRDIGWYLDRDLDFVDDETADRCLGSDLRATVIVGGVDTGVTNTFFTDGCSIVDRVNRCKVDPAPHGDYVSCVSAWTNTLKAAGELTGAQKAAIQAAAAKNK